MLPTVDPAILSALSLSPTSTKLISTSSSSFTSTYKLTSTRDGLQISYFVKTAPGPAADAMFRGEHHSLNAIAAAVPFPFAPRSYAHGALQHTNTGTGTSGGASGGQGAMGSYFLATDYIDLGSSAPGGSGLTFAQKLAAMHNAPAPVPKGYDKPMYGFPVSTCCGATAQDNEWCASWPEFYADRRLRSVLREGLRRQAPGGDRELQEMVEKVAGSVVPRLIGEGRVEEVRPVLVHGDLWSGNRGRGRIGGRGGAEEVVYDPSCVYGHSEYELGIVRMFGGFGRDFWREYEELVPRAEPKGEWEDRIALYEL